MLAIKCILKVTHATSELIGQICLQGSTRSQRSQRGKEQDMTSITQRDITTNVLVPKTFCVLLLIFVTYCVLLQIILSVNIFMLLTQALVFVLHSPLYKGIGACKLHFPDSFACWVEAIFSCCCVWLHQQS